MLKFFPVWEKEMISYDEFLDDLKADDVKVSINAGKRMSVSEFARKTLRDGDMVTVEPLYDEYAELYVFCDGFFRHVTTGFPAEPRAQKLTKRDKNHVDD